MGVCGGRAAGAGVGNSRSRRMLDRDSWPWRLPTGERAGARGGKIRELRSAGLGVDLILRSLHFSAIRRDASVPPREASTVATLYKASANLLAPGERL